MVSMQMYVISMSVYIVG